jgi:hypothetical protein
MRGAANVVLIFIIMLCGNDHQRQMEISSVGQP